MIQTTIKTRVLYSYPATIPMKKRDLETELKRPGWYFLREGGNHEVWTNGRETEPIPRHREIDERLAGKIIRRATEEQP